MAQKVCLVPWDWSNERIAQRNCARDHHHANRVKAEAMVREGSGKWVDQGVVRLAGSFGRRDLSARVGPRAAEDYRAGQPWARVYVPTIFDHGYPRRTRR